MATIIGRRLFAVLWWLLIVGSVAGIAALTVKVLVELWTVNSDEGFALYVQGDLTPPGALAPRVVVWWWLTDYWPFYDTALLPLLPLAALIVGRWAITDRWRFGPRW